MAFEDLASNLPFGPGGAMGRNADYRNAFAQAQEKLKYDQQNNPLLLQGKREENRHDIAFNPMLEFEKQLKNSYDQENNPLLLQGKREENRHNIAYNPILENQGRLTNQGLGLTNAFNQQTMDYRVQNSKNESDQYLSKGDDAIKAARLAQSYTPETQGKNFDPKFKEFLDKNVITAQIAAKNKALNAGQSGKPAATRLEAAFHAAIGRDNPQFAENPQDIWDAANAIRNGQNTLPDGRPLNVSENTMSALAAAVKGAYTTALINQTKNAQQAEAEQKVLQPYIEKGIKAAGTTYKGRSLVDVIAELSNDPKQYDRLADIIASNVFQFDSAALQNRMQGVQPGVTSLEHVMQLSGQHVDVWAGRVPAEVRQKSARIVAKGTLEMLRAREKVGINPAGAAYPNMNRETNASSNEARAMSTEELLKIVGGG